MIRCDDLALGEQRWGGWEAWVGEQRSGEPAQPDWLDEKHSPHGWRSSFSTLARDNGTARDVVELALDHVHDNEVARAYDRGERFDERVKLLDWWGKQLAIAQRGATIIPLKTKAS